MILIIDDDHDRFDGLTRLFEDRASKGHPVPEIRITCVRSEIETWLPQAHAVLLDYDLDLGDTHYPDKGWRKGTAYVPMLLATGLPLIVLSTNYEGGKLLNHQLVQAQKQPSTLLRANETDPEIRWLGWLYQHGVL